MYCACLSFRTFGSVGTPSTHLSPLVHVFACMYVLTCSFINNGNKLKKRGKGKTAANQTRASNLQIRPFGSCQHIRGEWINGLMDAVYWSNKAWEDVTSVTLKKSWRKLIPSSVAVISESKCDTGNSPYCDEFASLFSDLGCSDDNPSWQNPQEWLNEDADDQGYQLMTDNEIVTQVTGQNDSDTDSDDMTL